MPLSGIGRRGTPLGGFTFRELAAQKRLAERALRRGRNPEAARLLIDRIEAELAERRLAVHDRRSADVPDLPDEAPRRAP